MSMTTDERYRLIIFGDNKVGKTSIIRRYLNNSFTTRYKPTKEDIYSRDFNIRNTTMKLDILDTNIGSNKARRVHISNAHSFMLVLRVDCPASYNTVQSLLDEIQSARQDDFNQIPIVIVGNQIDVDKTDVTSSYIVTWLKSVNASHIKYIECSAKDGINIVDIFQSLLDASGFGQKKFASRQTSHGASPGLSPVNLMRSRSLRMSRSNPPERAPSYKACASPMASRQKYLGIPSLDATNDTSGDEADNGGLIRSTKRLSIRIKKIAMGEDNDCDRKPAQEAKDECKIS